VRSLHPDLVTSQQQGGQPFFIIGICAGTNPLGVYTDYADRLLSLDLNEKPFGGVGTILLDNSDLTLNGLDWRGRAVLISLGYVTSSGARSSNMAPWWVLDHKSKDVAGQATVELTLMDTWQRIGLEVIVSGGQNLSGTPLGQFEPGMWIVGRSSGARAKVVFAGSNYLKIGSVQANPSGGGFLTGEIIQSEILPGSTMVISGISDWNGGPGPGWTAQTPYGIIHQLLASMGIQDSLDNSDGIVNIRQIQMYTQTGANVLQVIQDALGRTKTSARIGNDGKVHLFSVVSDPSPSYTYQQGAHTTVRNSLDTRLVLPTRILVYNSKDHLSSSDVLVGSAEDTVASARYGRPILQIVDVEIQSNAEGDEVAAALLRKSQMEAQTGEVESLVNCGQELLDYIQVVDDRTGVTFTGYVGGLRRIYQANQGINKQILSLGGLAEAATLDNPMDQYQTNYPTSKAPEVGYTNVPSPVQAGEKLVLVDVPFTPVSNNRVTWTGGYLRFSDGSVQFIQPGSRDMTSDHEFGWVADGSDTLQWTVSLGGVQGPGRVFVVQLNRDLGVGFNLVQVIPATGDWRLNLDQVYDGPNFARLRRSGVTSLGFVNMDFVAEGSTFGKVQLQALNGGGMVLLDRLIEDTISGTYARPLRTSLQNGVVLLDRVMEGTYGRILAADLDSGHHVRASRITQETNFWLVNDQEKSGAGLAYGFLVSKGVQYGLNITSSLNNRRVELGSYGIIVTGKVTEDPIGGLGFRVTPTSSVDHYLGMDLARSDTGQYLPTFSGYLQASGFVMTSNFSFFGPRLPVGSGNQYTYFNTRDRGNNTTLSVFMPYDDDEGDLGAALNRWHQIYTYFVSAKWSVSCGDPGTVSTNAGVFPYTGNYGFCGNSSNYWSGIYGWDVRYKTLGTFHDEDDFSLVKQLHEGFIKDQHPETGEEVVSIDPARAHPRLLDPTGEFFSAGAVQGLALGTLHKLILRVEELEAELRRRK
jgi:hypothetical protein